jgi:sigma-E factor negative regulatory protein RseC
MIQAQAVVVAVERGVARVRVSDRQDGCGRCDEPGGCRSVRIAHVFKAPEEEFRVPDTLGLQQGDRVLIRMADGAPLRGAMVSYGLGAALLVVGAGLGHLWAGGGQQDAYALAGAAAGLGLTMAINRLLHFSRAWRNRLHIALVRDDGECAPMKEREATA